jgi:hypothetical protein
MPTTRRNRVASAAARRCAGSSNAGIWPQRQLHKVLNRRQEIDLCVTGSGMQGQSDRPSNEFDRTGRYPTRDSVEQVNGQR